MTVIRKSLSIANSSILKVYTCNSFQKIFRKSFNKRIQERERFYQSLATSLLEISYNEDSISFGC